MGKITVYYEKHHESFFGKYWGLILFPLLPFWLLSRDDGMAGYLDVDGHTFKLKYKKKEHPQEIQLSEGVHQIVYRKKSKFAIAFNLWTRSSGGTLDNILDSMGAYDDYKLDGFELNFGPDTNLKLRAEGGVLRKCKIEDIENALPLPQEDNYGTPPKAKKINFGCLAPILILVGLMALGVYASNNSGKLIDIINGGNSNGSNISHVQTSHQGKTESVEETIDQTQEKPLNKKMFVRAEGGLNLREGPSQKHKKILLMPERVEVTVFKIENGWAFLEYEGKQGWSSMEFLVEDSALLDEPEENINSQLQNEEKRRTQDDINEARDAALTVIDSYFGKTVDGGRKDITVDNVVEFFEKAQRQYNYWTNFGGQFEKLSEPLKFDIPYGINICMVEGDSYSTIEELCNRYFSLFSDEVAKTCLDYYTYLFDGKLAVATDGSGAEGRYVSHSYEVEQISNTQINVIVTVKEYEDFIYTADGVEKGEIVDKIYTFPCIVEDEIWVFKEMKGIYS